MELLITYTVYAVLLLPGQALFFLTGVPGIWTPLAFANGRELFGR